MDIKEKIDAAYETHTLAPLRAAEKEQAARNDAFNSSRQAARETPLTNAEQAYLAHHEDELDDAVEEQIKSIVAEKHCSREQAKNKLRSL